MVNTLLNFPIPVISLRCKIWGKPNIFEAIAPSKVDIVFV